MFENTAQSLVSASTDAIRVMVVDDSAVIRGLIWRMLEPDGEITVVASASSGELAVKELSRTDVDVIILDIEMPVMDGLTALPKLLEADPGVKILMTSALTLNNAEISLRALQAGAADYVPKPTATGEISGGEDFHRDLLAKVKALGEARRRRQHSKRRLEGAGSRTLAAVPKPGVPAVIDLRQPGVQRPDILAIGSSTGGPQALLALLKEIPLDRRLPIVITQHMPPTFTTILARHITKSTEWPCTEGTDGEPISPGHIYLAPGDFHMVVEAEGSQRVLHLNQGPPENFCRPAVDVMLRSVAKVYAGRVLTVILTGMGHDGLEGSKLIADAGGTIIAQDEATSVVWGMPGAVATAGLCSAVLPLNELPPYIGEIASRGVS
jgi:two-component system chemotaxis response regulator CheB